MRIWTICQEGKVPYCKKSDFHFKAVHICYIIIQKQCLQTRHQDFSKVVMSQLCSHHLALAHQDPVSGQAAILLCVCLAVSLKKQAIRRLLLILIRQNTT